VLVECGFLSNPEEAALLGEEAYRFARAAMLVSAVMGHTEGSGDPP
jgi:N-acetylmuramoyl-L-alanine amidase